MPWGPALACRASESLHLSPVGLRTVIGVRATSKEMRGSLE